MYIIWFQFSYFLSPFYYFDYYEHQYFTSVLFHMFSFIKNALFGSYSWMSHRTFLESSAVTTAFWLDQYGGRFASIFRPCPPSMFWGQWFHSPTWTHCRKWDSRPSVPAKFKHVTNIVTCTCTTVWLRHVRAGTEISKKLTSNPRLSAKNTPLFVFPQIGHSLQIFV